MTQTIIRDLGEGLILRRSTREDARALADFQGDIQSGSDTGEPDSNVAAWVEDLMERPHPTFDPADFTLVENTRTGEIVSSLCLISQTWTYGGIPFGVGRPELVATHRDYRGRGLVRAQMAVVHEWSAQRGEQMQAITGIPYFYRQFGYEMAMTLGGSRIGYRSHVPRLKEGEAEPYRVRQATEADLSFVTEVNAYGSQRYPVTCVWDEAMWRYELVGKSDNNICRRALRIIERVGGEPVGFLLHSTMLHSGGVSVVAYELKPDVSWLAVTPPLVRYLWSEGERLAAPDPEKVVRFAFNLGAEHPVYQVFEKGLPHTVPAYAWYLRVPDLVGFLQHIAPELERRLAGSALVGHTGAIEISFYRTGLRLAFEEGRLATVTPWQPPEPEAGDASFPDLTFLQLLFGYRSLGELDHAFADCWTSKDEARALLEALFPKRPSDVWPAS
ncbi:MAG: GNAT family N-acetyltransferase [Anaerolineae bacterium]